MKKRDFPLGVTSVETMSSNESAPKNITIMDLEKTRSLKTVLKTGHIDMNEDEAKTATAKEMQRE